MPSSSKKASKEAMKREPIVEHVVTEFERYENFHRDRFDEDKKVMEQWKNKAPNKSYPWMNSVNVPLMVEGEQVITPRLFTALFPTEAPVDVHVEGDAPEEQGIRIKGIIEHHFRVADVQMAIHPALTQTTLFGTGYVEGGSWKVKKAWMTKPTPDGKGARYYTTIDARPDATWVDYFEIFPHPAKLYVKDGLPVIRRHYIDQEALKKMAVDSKWAAEDLQDALNSDPPEGMHEEYDQNKERVYEILQYWGPWDEQVKDEDGAFVTDDDGNIEIRQAVPYWVIVVNRKIKLRGIPNPYNHQLPPYCRMKLFEDPKPSWFGVGIGSIGKPTQDRVNKIVNQRLDNVDLVLNKQGFYNGNDTLINTKKLQVSKPGQWHKVSDTATSIRWMDTPDVTASSYKEEELAKQDFREATGALANLMPEQGTEHSTAMGIQLLQGAAGTRFRPVLRKLEIDLTQQLAMFFFANLKQFMTEKEWVVITGKDGKAQPIQITPEEIQARAMFIPTGISETMNKEVQVGQLLRFKEITMQDPTVNRQAINKRIAELMGFKDINELLTPVGGPAQSGGQGLTEEQKLKIQQRTAEGASPDEIKAEMLGPSPDQGTPGGAPQNAAQ